MPNSAKLSIAGIRDEDLPHTPIAEYLRINENTGLPDGNDGKNPETNPKTGRPFSSGYRSVLTSKDMREPLILADGVEVDYVYKRLGFRGTVEEGMIARQNVVIGVKEFAERVRRLSGNAWDVRVADMYRPRETQEDGHGYTFETLLTENSISKDAVNVGHILQYGRMADDTFSWVNPVEESKEYVAVVQELKADKKFMTDLEEAAVALYRGNHPEKTLGAQQIQEIVESALADYIATSASSGYGCAAKRGIPLNDEGNAHSGGGAVDLFITKNGKMLSPTRFDHSSPFASGRALEDEANWNAYRKAAVTDKEIQAHLTSIGIDYHNIPDSALNEFRMAARTIMGLILKVRGSFYDPGVKGNPAAWDANHPGENWHTNFPLTVVDEDGQMKQDRTDQRFPHFVGNTCLTLVNQEDTLDRVAPYGASTAKEYVATHYHVKEA